MSTPIIGVKDNKYTVRHYYIAFFKIFNRRTRKEQASLRQIPCCRQAAKNFQQVSYAYKYQEKTHLKRNHNHKNALFLY